MWQLFQIKVIRIDGEILLQKSGVFFFQLEDGVLNHGKVGLGVAVGALELLDIGRHQRAVGVVQKLSAHRIERQWIEAAGKWFVIAHVAALVTQMLTAFLDTNAAQFLFFNPRQADLQRWVPIVNRATALAHGTVVKEHSWPQTCVGCAEKAQRQRLLSNDADGHCVAISDVACHGQIVCALLLLLLMQVGICVPTLQSVLAVHCRRNCEPCKLCVV